MLVGDAAAAAAAAAGAAAAAAAAAAATAAAAAAAAAQQQLLQQRRQKPGDARARHVSDRVSDMFHKRFRPWGLGALSPVPPGRIAQFHMTVFRDLLQRAKLGGAVGKTSLKRKARSGRSREEMRKVWRKMSRKKKPSAFPRQHPDLPGGHVKGEWTMTT